VPLANPRPDCPNPDGFRQIEGGTSHDGRQLFGGTLWEVDGAVTRPANRVEAKVERRAMPPGVSRIAFVRGELGRTYLANARLAPALKLLKEATRAAPSWMAVKLAYGDALYFTGRPEDALGCYRAVAAAMPDSGNVHARLATVHLALGHSEDTEASLATSLALADLSFDQTTDLGVRYFGRREYVAAIAPLYASVKREPRDWRAQEYLGLIAYQTGNVGAALPRFRACLESAPPGAERMRIADLVEKITRAGSKPPSPRSIRAFDSPE
jgi:cytochrome c-type biogenesis protein CcmH/NrfG